ncbi:leukocyte-associated immunoglobulin-like receptor 2 [Sorex fumeus]|uniref:leukocyte-associated immunoglobulin-like receptor 2 n=1 Tax=Sorex fumeus TaxID=62283 RepID=UPI0024AD50A3|nr:leukocyte-associated immunoglobulin-like receptor 2 [Sorex fumeus]
MAMGQTMAPFPGVFLSLALCLSQMGPSREQAGFLSPPSISAQPDPDIPWGQPVTLVCQGPAGTNTFRLEKQYNMYSCADSTHEQCKYTDLTCKKEAWFLIPAVSGNSMGCYRCLYWTGSSWSERTDPLVMRTEDISDWTPGTPQLPSPSNTAQGDSPQLQGGPTLVLVYIIRTAALAFLLLILLLLLLLHQCWKRDLVTVDGALMLGRNRRASLMPAAGSPQEVTYAQLDQCTLTQRPPGSAPSRTADPTTKDCTYATLARP